MPISPSKSVQLPLNAGATALPSAAPRQNPTVVQIFNKTTAEDTKKQAAFDLKRVLGLAVGVRAMIIADVPDKSLKVFEIALGKGTRVLTNQQPTFKQFHGQVQKENDLRRELNNLLEKHPGWRKTVESWMHVSTQDKIWILRMHELTLLGVDIPYLKDLYRNIQAVPVTVEAFKPMAVYGDLEDEVVPVGDDGAVAEEPNGQTPALMPIMGNEMSFTENHAISPKAIDLLRSKEEIQKALGSVVQLKLAAKHSVSRETFCLLPNLEELDLESTKLTCPPDLSKNLKLKRLILNNNELGEFPDLKSNTALERLVVTSNKFSKLPSFSFHPELKHLNLSGNDLQIPPDVRENKKLAELILSRNRLLHAPNLTKNTLLEALVLQEANLKFLPDLSKNGNLGHLNIANNPITTEQEAMLPDGTNVSLYDIACEAIRKLRTTIPNLDVVMDRPVQF